MKKPSVYIETSVVSYITNKLSNELIVAAHQQISREWWDHKRNFFDLFASELVEQESLRGNPEAAEKRMVLLNEVKMLPVTNEASELSELILSKGALPLIASADALHLAIAITNKTDYLLSWNCKHIVNANVARKLMEITSQKGLAYPILCTPFELFEDNN